MSQVPVRGLYVAHQPSRAPQIIHSCGPNAAETRFQPRKDELGVVVLIRAQALGTVSAP